LIGFGQSKVGSDGTHIKVSQVDPHQTMLGQTHVRSNQVKTKSGQFEKA